jgi:hypothetical protein
MTKVITTKKGFSCTVDEEDYELLSKYSWHVINGLFATNMLVNGKYQTTYMHRMLTNAPNGDVVIHIDKDMSNNCKSNLMVMSRSDSRITHATSKRNKTGYRGVSYRPEMFKYTAVIKKKEKITYLGCFDCPKEASKAYETALAEIYPHLIHLRKV